MAAKKKFVLLVGWGGAGSPAPISAQTKGLASHMKGFRDCRTTRSSSSTAASGHTCTKGIYINTCFDELDIYEPDIVREVHRDYVAAGADVIETNTFGANRFKLAPHGLEPKVFEIHLKGAQLAKSRSGGEVLVAGSVGPLGVQIEPLGKLSYDEARDAFKEQVRGLLEGGIDLIVPRRIAELDGDPRREGAGTRISRSWRR